jgi:Fe-S cluster assembly protein SufD
MVEVLNEKDAFLTAFTQFEKDRGERDAVALRRLRRAGIERFAEVGFPTTRTEDWRFTNVSPITKVPFDLARPIAGAASKDWMELVPAIAQRLVFINGYLAPTLSALSNLPKGVIVDSLAHVLKSWPEVVEPHLAQHADYEEHPFTALNTGFVADGAFVHVPKGVALETPLHLVFVTTAAKPAMTHPRNLIVLGASSQAAFVESYLGSEGEVYFTNAVTEIVVGENAVVDHYRLQRESKAAFHVTTTQVHQARSSNFSTHYIGLGGGLVRNEVRVVLDGEGCETTVNGLYMASGAQHLDNFTVIDHAKPHCASHELYKGILDGKAHGVFNGKIFVRQDAQKTDAKQTNQTLLLSDDATINTKPQLEIFADDVKCTHGATVGQLDADAIFYLRSRGLGHAEARALLTFAFANDIVSRLKVAPLREQLEAALLAAQHLPTDVSVKEIG